MGDGDFLCTYLASINDFDEVSSTVKCLSIYITDGASCWYNGFAF